MALTNIFGANTCRNVYKAVNLQVVRGWSNAKSVYALNQKWRREQKLPMNPNAYGPLTDGPDFSYLDGRPAPLGASQLNRMLKQQQIAKDVIRLCGEVDFAVEHHKQRQLDVETERQRILGAKLKPKGKFLLKKKKLTASTT